MRRSKSCSRISGIPVVSSMQRQKIRSSSQERSNPDVLSTPLQSQLPNWAASTASSQSASLYPLTVTPYGSNFKRSRSTSSFGAGLGSSRGKSPVSKKQIRPTDKKWVDEQYMKIKDFITTSGLFNPELADQIKPPTMATFVELVGVLLGRLAKTIPINTQNCFEELLKWLKNFGYPGQVTLSTLKTINTLHAWPHFISIISWLITRVNLNLASDEVWSRTQLDPTDQVAIQLHYALFNYLRQKCGQLAGPSDIEGLDDDFYQQLIEIKEIDCDEVQKSKEAEEVERANFQRIDAQVVKIQQEREEREAHNSKMADVIQNFEESGCNREVMVKEELEQLKVSFQKLTETKEALTQFVGKLEIDIAQQPYTVKYRDELIRQIEDQKRLLERKEQQTRSLQVMRDDIDMKLKKYLSQVESVVDQWKMSLKKTFLPELHPLLLREKGFFSKEDFLKEITRMKSNKTQLFDQLLTEYQTSQDELATLLKRKQVLMEEDFLLNASRHKLDSVKTKIAALRDQNQQLSVRIEEARKKHDTDLQQLKDEEEAKILKVNEKIHDLERRQQKNNKAIDETCKAYLAATTEAHNNIVQDLSRIKEAKVRMIKEATDYLTETTQRTSELMENLDAWQKIRKFLTENQ